MVLYSAVKMNSILFETPPNIYTFLDLTMKDIFPDHVETSKEEKPKKNLKFINWILRQNAFLWGGITGAFIAIYRNFDRILSWFS